MRWRSYACLLSAFMLPMKGALGALVQIHYLPCLRGKLLKGHRQPRLNGKPIAELKSWLCLSNMSTGLPHEMGLK